MRIYITAVTTIILVIIIIIIIIIINRINRTITMIIDEIINITIQPRLIVRVINKGIVNMGVFIIIRGTIIIIIIFANIRVIFMTKLSLLSFLSITLIENLLL